MTEQTAFGGDPAVKAGLLARIDAHVAAGTLVTHDVVWDGARGSALGVSIEGSDPAEYARRFGFPLPLAGALDILCGQFHDTVEAQRYAREWVEVVEPGADLSDVPRACILDVLERTAMPEDAAVHCQALTALHVADREGEVVTRAEWSQCRAAIEEASRDAQSQHRIEAFALLDAAAWPAGRGQSLLTGVLEPMKQLALAGCNDSWTEEQAKRSRSVLQAIWDEHESARENDEFVDYPAIFLAREPELARGFEANLDMENAAYEKAGVEFARLCLDHLRRASRPEDQHGKSGDPAN